MPLGEVDFSIAVTAIVQAEITNARDRARAVQSRAVLTGDAAPGVPLANDWPQPKGGRRLGGKGAGDAEEG